MFHAMLYLVGMKKEREQEPSHLSIEVVAEKAKERALAAGGHEPTILVKGTKETISIQLPELGETHEERQQEMFGIGFLVGDSQLLGKLQQAFLTTEGWLSMADKEKEPVYPPSQDPKRKEVLVISEINVETGDTAETNILLFEMVRDKEQNLKDLQPFKELDKQGDMSSPLLDAFIQGYVAGVITQPKQ
jgi:hypothetical protein